MASGGGRHWAGDKDATCYVGNIDERVHDALIYELFLQMGRVVNVHLPKDRVTQVHQGFGFVEFREEREADFAAKVLNGVKMYNKPLRVNKASADKSKTPDVGAELFIGNLEQETSESELYNTFSRFGQILVTPKVTDDPFDYPLLWDYRETDVFRIKVARDENGISKGYAFISYVDFEASDSAIEKMNGQMFSTRQIVVQYALKKDGKGERHGDAAERELAAQAKRHGVTLNPAPAPAPNAPPSMQVTSQPAFFPNRGGVAGPPPIGGPPPPPLGPGMGGFGQAPRPSVMSPPGFNTQGWGAMPPVPGGPPPPPGFNASPAPAAGSPPPPGFGGPPPPGMPNPPPGYSSQGFGGR